MINLFENLFCFSFDDIFNSEPYVNLTEQLIKEKLVESDEYANHAGAAVTESFLKAIQNRYDRKVMEDRIKIIFQIASRDYNRDNVSRHAIISVTKENKIHYFLYNWKEEIIKSVIKMFNTDSVSSEFLDNKTNIF